MTSNRQLIMRALSLHLTSVEIVFLLICLAYYSIWTLGQLNYAPDEAMRYAVTRFLYDHGRLPVGAETVDGLWGHSYAHIPTMFCNVMGACLMKVCSVVVASDRGLLVAARWVSVICAVGAVYWTIRAAKLLFSTSVRWLMICFVALLPQFSFLAGYVNNDMPAVLGVSMVLFAWTDATVRKWDFGNCSILTLGMSVCLMSYYNSYAWVLMSVVVFPALFWLRNGRDFKTMMMTALWIALSTSVISGYLFIRHAILYGDLLGFETMERYAAEYAAPVFKQGIVGTVKSEGQGLMEMIIGRNWLVLTVKSFIGCFGYIAYPLSKWCYAVYIGVLGIGAFGCLMSGWDRIVGRRRISVQCLVLAVSCTICAVITLWLHLRYSYEMDFQPQGRYCFPALIVMAIFVAKGVEFLCEGFRSPRIFNWTTGTICLLLAGVAWCAVRVFLVTISR